MDSWVNFVSIGVRIKFHQCPWTLPEGSFPRHPQVRSDWFDSRLNRVHTNQPPIPGVPCHVQERRKGLPLQEGCCRQKDICAKLAWCVVGSSSPHGYFLLSVPLAAFSHSVRWAPFCRPFTIILASSHETSTMGEHPKWALHTSLCTRLYKRIFDTSHRLLRSYRSNRHPNTPDGQGLLS